jgi:hypothetical protein
MTRSIKQNELTESIELNLGSRSINNQGLHNKSIIIPKIVLEGCGLRDAKKAQITLVKKNTGETFIKISECFNDVIVEKSLTSSNHHDFLTFNPNKKSKRSDNHNGDDNKND